jgi:UV DNA damage endonuclease
MRVGYCCINETLKIGIKTITLKKFKTLSQQDQYNVLKDLTRENFDNLLKVIRWNVDNGIGMFRVSSDIVPLATIPNITYKFHEDEYIIKICSTINELCTKYDIRLTIHPSQFVVLNSYKSEVVDNSIKELDHHEKICKLLNIKTINLHVGGVYGDKTSAMNNFISNFNNKLPANLKRLVALENDDKSYNVEETLFLCEKCEVPMILDLHHDRILQSPNNIESYIERISKTWGFNTPLAHISTSADESKLSRKHHDFITIDDYNNFSNILLNKFDIEFECKKKELGILNLRNVIKNI